MLKREIISIHLERITSISKRSREEKKKVVTCNLHATASRNVQIN